MTTQVSLMTRLQTCLSQPNVLMRCVEVEQILQEVNTKDASYIFCTIVESLFVVTSRNITPSSTSTQSSPMSPQPIASNIGWGMHVITLTEHRAEFSQMRALLGPNGPLLSLAYKLSHDPFQLLPFPVAYLPMKVRVEIEEGTAGGFYTNKIQNAGHAKAPSNIMLNIFEFYMFHFAHFLLSTGNLCWSSVNDALYPTLMEEYLQVFLPCDASTPPGPPSPPVSPRGVLSPVVQRTSSGGSSFAGGINLSCLMSPIYRPVRSPEVTQLSPPFPHLETSFAIPPNQASSPIMSHHQPHTNDKMWTSQVVAQVFLEMWLWQGISVQPKSHHHTLQPQAQPQMQPTQYHGVYIPSSDHVKVVRMLVKHLHYFSNSIKPNQPSPLDHLKRSIWGVYRKSVYEFLKHLFNHWPLDASFRLVLETWLSYIQPWRYLEYQSSSNISGAQRVQVAESDTRSVDAKWVTFIGENLLLYTHLLQVLLPRFHRMDLAAFRNANIMFRVSKVFSQDNLSTLIHECEEGVENSYQMQRFLGGASSLSSPPKSHHQNPPLSAHSLSQLCRAHIVDMEGPNHQYIPVFSNPVRNKVSRLLTLAKAALDAVGAEIASKSATSTTSETATHDNTNSLQLWLNYLSSNLFGDSQKLLEEASSLEEIKKCQSHLDVTITNLCAIFNLPLPEISNFIHEGQAALNASLRNSPQKLKSPDLMHTENGPVLTSIGKRQLLTGLRRFDLKYEGDPDLRPVATWEVTFLVRWLYAFTAWLNLKYSSDIISLYNRQDFVGGIVRGVLLPPQTIYEYTREGMDAPRTRRARDLSPRISLRLLADKKLLGYSMLLYFVLHLSGFSLLSMLLNMLLPGVLLVLFCKGIWGMRGNQHPQGMVNRDRDSFLAAMSPQG